MKINLYALALLTGTAFSAVAAGTIVPVSDQEELTMTIYNQGRALVKDTRAVDLKAGLNQISFQDISNMVMPETVLLKANGVVVQEQNFNFDLLNRENMLQKAVGQIVNVEFINPATGVVSTDKAELLSYDGNKPVLKIAGKVETDYPGRVVFNQVPENLTAKPTLVFDVNSAAAVKENVEVSYLTEGLSWTADYVAELDANDKLALNGLVTLTNNTQVGYYNARLQLVAGEVNVVHYKSNAAWSTSTRAMAMDAGMASEAVAGYHLYTLKRPTDILSRQTKQVSLLSGNNIAVGKTYEYDSLMNYFSDSDFKNAKPVMYLSFENTQANGLGEALPKGIVRVYQKESSGRLIFVGEDRISHTAKNQDVRLRLGEDFDITATGKRVNFQKIDSKTSQASFEIKISNAKPAPVVVRYNQYLPDGWKIVSESLKSKKETSNQIYWDVAVGAETDVILTFKILVDNR